MRHITSLFIVCYLLLSCDKTTIIETSSDPPPVVNEPQENGKLYIIDATGKEWDVTHAARKYNMLPNKFQYGLGPNVIRPILKPQFFVPNELGWPSSGDFLVVATRINKDARVYPISIMKNFEIANETFGDTLVAVAY